ncbi:MAG: DsbA family protein [Pseudomonadota bacterium]|uniref:DsbA family protein n=1 Tax=Phenylobacterium sp. TaxID=1871053 RepID=UPI0025DA572B|nr:DsbA family protein [Phenylobacterium sp.]MBT9470190.1 DsbA family protein [Phenylobacterium sp.]
MTSKPLTEMRRSIAGALEVVGDRWTLLLIHDMALGVRRFDDLRANMRIPRSTLAARLKNLETRGLLERVRYQTRPPRDEYRLTEMGRDVWMVTAALREWGDRWNISGDGATVVELVDRDTGQEIRLGLVDPKTGHSTPPDRVAHRPGAGADDAVRALLQTLDKGNRRVAERLEFYFDFQSPYSYLAHSQLAGLGTPVQLVPISVGPLMKLVSNTPTTMTCPAKFAYASKDLGRWAARYGVQVIAPERDLLDGDLLLRLVTATTDEAFRAKATDAIFKAVWGGQGDASPKGLEQLLAARGLPAAELIAAANQEAIVAALSAATETAARRGVFGAPTFFVGDEMFFGNDRLDFVRECLALRGGA